MGGPAGTAIRATRRYGRAGAHDRGGSQRAVGAPSHLYHDVTVVSPRGTLSINIGHPTSPP